MYKLYLHFCYFTFFMWMSARTVKVDFKDVILLDTYRDKTKPTQEKKLFTVF